MPTIVNIWKINLHIIKTVVKGRSKRRRVGVMNNGEKGFNLPSIYNFLNLFYSQIYFLPTIFATNSACSAMSFGKYLFGTFPQIFW